MLKEGKAGRAIQQETYACELKGGCKTKYIPLTIQLIRKSFSFFSKIISLIFSTLHPTVWVIHIEHKKHLDTYAITKFFPQWENHYAKLI